MRCQLVGQAQRVAPAVFPVLVLDVHDTVVVEFGFQLYELAPVGPVDARMQRQRRCQLMEQGQLGGGGQRQIQAAGIGEGLPVLIDADGVAGEFQGDVVAVGEADAGRFRQLQQGTQVPAHGPAIPFQVLGDLVVGREGATHFPFALNGGEAGADGPDAVDAVGQRRPQIHGLDVGDIAEVAGVVVVRHLDAEPVIGGGSQPQAPLVVERHYEVGVGHPGIIGDVVGRRIQADRPLGVGTQVVPSMLASRCT